jgi:hypothetical protein
LFGGNGRAELHGVVRGGTQRAAPNNAVPFRYGNDYGVNDYGVRVASVRRRSTESAPVVVYRATVLPISLPSRKRITLRVLTWTPFRSTLSYGPFSVTMLSPETSTTRVETGGRPGNVIVQPVVSALALSCEMTAVVSPDSGTARTVHRPATSASEVGAGAALTATPPAAVSVVAAASSDFAQPTRARPVQKQANVRRRIIAPSNGGDVL